MVRRKAAAAASWVGEKLLTIVVLALLLMVFGIPVVIFTQMGMSDTWAYLAMAAFLVGVTGIIVACVLWGVKKGDRIRRGID
jgi:hypothetical protein